MFSYYNSLMKICTFNVENLFFNLPFKEINKENLFEFQDYSVFVNNDVYVNKDFSKIEEIAKYFNEIDADVIGLVEIGGYSSLNNLNKYFLNNHYDCYLMESCSFRPIYTGFLIKKGICDEVKCMDLGPRYQMSRNLMSLSLFKNEENLANFLLCHLKSQRGLDSGIDKRYQEVNNLMRIYKTLPSDKPFFLMGDFNGIATSDNRQFEFDSIYETDLKDCLEIFSSKDRETHISFKDGISNSSQLDYIFLNEKSQELLTKAYVYRPKSFNQKIIPKDYDERRKLLASDHLPLVIEVDLK